MRSRVAPVGLGLLVTVACSGSPLNVNPQTGAAGAGAMAGAAAAGSAGGGGAGVGGQGGDAPLPIDPGHLPPRRLNALEYDNTMRDLLGVTAQARATFQPDERSWFDNDAEATTMNDARYEQYASEAQRLADVAFADPKLRARIVSCQPGNDAVGCARLIAKAFGGRAWRRPLTDAEVGDLASVAA